MRSYIPCAKCQNGIGKPINKHLDLIQFGGLNCCIITVMVTKSLKAATLPVQSGHL